jgi:hypothetical protein
MAGKGEGQKTGGTSSVVARRRVPMAVGDRRRQGEATAKLMCMWRRRDGDRRGAHHAGGRRPFKGRRHGEKWKEGGSGRSQRLWPGVGGCGRCCCAHGVGMLRTGEGGSSWVRPSCSERERGEREQKRGTRKANPGRKKSAGQGRKKKRMGPAGEQCHFSFIQYFSN